MSDHDELMSLLIKMRAVLSQYVDEYDPDGGLLALEHLEKTMLLADKFPGESG